MANTETIDTPLTWLGLVHHFPKKSGSLRTKIWRRLQGVGAITIKNSLYILPSNDQTREDFEWILKELLNGGAEGIILEAQFVEGMDDNQIKSLFDKARDEDFSDLAQELREYQSHLRKGMALDVIQNLETHLARFKKRLWEIDSIDFFGANGRETVEGLIRNMTLMLETKINNINDNKREVMRDTANKLQGNIWVTRQNIHVDRIASAWLVKEFIDENATFKFTPDKHYKPKENEVRFDMFDAEYTHEGDNCTFEVLLEKANLKDSALKRIGEIIHDIDLKDGKFGHDETVGIALLIKGLSATVSDDLERMKKGSEIFDNLYQVFTD